MTAARPIVAPFAPPWLVTARSEIGVRERPGKPNNARIQEYHAATRGGGVLHRLDQTAWCSSFLNWVFARYDIEGTRSKRARSWESWGVELTEPVLGCVVVFSRGPKLSGLGHVALFEQQLGEMVLVTGGNQKNSVCRAGYPLRRVITYRWPDTPPALSLLARLRDAS